MFCNPIFMLNFLLFFLLILPSDLKGMNQDDLDENHPSPLITQQAINFKRKTSSPRMDDLPTGFMDFPEDMINDIFHYLASNDFLLLRTTSKKLKERIDQDYWEKRSLTIRAKSSFPALQDIKDLPCTSASLFFHKWGNKDLAHLLTFKNVTHLHLSGLQSWDFSTNELFNPSLICSFCSYFKALINHEDFYDSIFTNVTLLDLSGSKIGSYGVSSFLSQFKNLKTLNLCNNDIGSDTEGEVKAIENLTSLTSLNISHNEFSDAGIKEFAQLKNITYLDISYNFIFNDSDIRKLKKALPKLIHLTNKGQRQKYNFSSYIPASGIYSPLPWRPWPSFNYGLPYRGR